MAKPKRTYPDPKYAKWDTARKYQRACEMVVYEGESQAEAARLLGISRPHLHAKVKVFREKHEARLEAAQAELDAKAGRAPVVRVENESRRLPETYGEFDDYYFGHVICPDCGENHRRKPFHDELIEAIEDPEHHRVVINMPPFHAKTTYATVRGSVWKLLKNPNHRRIIVSKSTAFARTLMQGIDQLLTNEELYLPDRNLIADWGPFKPEGTHSIWNQDQIYVAGRITTEKDPSILVMGLLKQIYGRRADDILCDDIADVDNQRNPEQVRQQLEWLTKMAGSRVGKSGKISYVGTRVQPGDIYATLKALPGYKVINYSCILDDTNELVLWPEHFPYSQAMLQRNEMLPADFQLIYQNVDVPGLGASFTQEMIDLCKDQTRVMGHYESGWRLILGIDPAGANKDSGETAMTVWGIDPRTGVRYLVDQLAVKSMKAPQLKEAIFSFCDRYPIFEIRVEVNGVQAQLVQYNDEISKPLAQRGIRVVPHTTHKNKWDPQFGVESIAPLFATQMVSLPWGNQHAAASMQPFIEQLITFPMGVKTDRVMSMWFAELGAREILRRQHLPMFNERMKVPDRIRRRRHVVDFGAREVRGVPLLDQRSGHVVGDRLVQGRPLPHGEVREGPPPTRRKFVNVGGWVDIE